MIKLEHKIEIDAAGFSARPRLTCVYCEQAAFSNSTLVQQPYMSDAEWELLVSKFKKKHRESSAQVEKVTKKPEPKSRVKRLTTEERSDRRARRDHQYERDHRYRQDLELDENENSGSPAYDLPWGLYSWTYVGIRAERHDQIARWVRKHFGTSVIDDWTERGDTTSVDRALYSRAHDPSGEDLSVEREKAKREKQRVYQRRYQRALRKKRQREKQPVLQMTDSALSAALKMTDGEIEEIARISEERRVEQSILDSIRKLESKA